MPAFAGRCFKRVVPRRRRGQTFYGRCGSRRRHSGATGHDALDCGATPATAGNPPPALYKALYKWKAML
jgi:hypothetical protein